MKYMTHANPEKSVVEINNFISDSHFNIFTAGIKVIFKKLSGLLNRHWSSVIIWRESISQNNGSTAIHHPQRKQRACQVTKMFFQYLILIFFRNGYGVWITAAKNALLFKDITRVATEKFDTQGEEAWFR